MLSHGNLLANAEDSLAALALDDTDMTLSHLPIAHSFERTAGYYTVDDGRRDDRLCESLGQIASNLTEVQPTVVLTVPRLLEVIHSRVLRTVETSPPMRQRLFKMALNAGEQAVSTGIGGNRCLQCSRSRWRYTGGWSLRECARSLAVESVT